MGNLIKKPKVLTPAEQYSKNALQYSMYASNFPLEKQLQFRYELIQEFKNNPNELNNVKKIMNLKMYNDNIKKYHMNSIPIVDGDIEDQWLIKYNEYIKTDEYKNMIEEENKKNEAAKLAAEEAAAKRAMEKQKEELKPHKRQVQQQKRKTRIAGVLRYGRKRQSLKKKRSEFGRKRRSSKRRVYKK